MKKQTLFNRINHFHFLVKVKEEDRLKKFFKDKIEKGSLMVTSQDLQGFKNLEGLIENLISKQFSNFFNAYSKAFNKQHGRKGNLFMHTFKRKQITDEVYLRKLIHYIHYNPIEVWLVQSLADWKYSSYRIIVSKGETKLQREETINCFNDIENFKYCYEHPPSITGIE